MLGARTPKQEENGAIFKMKCDRYVLFFEENVEETPALPAVSSGDPAPPPDIAPPPPAAAGRLPLDDDILNDLINKPDVWKEIDNGVLLLVDKKSRVFKNSGAERGCKDFWS